EEHAGVAIGMGIVEMRNRRLAATHLDRHRAADISLLRYSVTRERRHLVAGGAVGGPAEQAKADIVLCYRNHAVLLEIRHATGMVAVEVSQDRVLDRQRRDRLDGGLDLVAERRELRVHHKDAVGADRNRDVATLPFQ